MAPLRTPFQGVRNIVRFNWHFFALAAAGVGVGLLLAPWLPPAVRPLAYLGCIGMTLSTIASLGSSYYVYDRSPLYRLEWLARIRVPLGGTIVNVHAGFDETSVLLRAGLPDAKLRVLDFYDPVQHTEISIRRARRAYPPFPDTETVQTAALPLADASTDAIFALFAAHEIRAEAERTAFFRELRRALRPDGRIVVTEHLRDWSNFMAYSIGFLHFYSRPVWERVFAEANLRVVERIQDIPLVTTFILEARAAAP